MPSAMLKACPGDGGTCPELVASGYCPAHTATAVRGSAHARGYTRAWQRFRLWFIQKLIAAGVVPVCGARWPGLPSTGDSRCQADGRLNDRRLHLDHTPPLTDAERRIERCVCDVARLQLLCQACHNAKSAREQSPSQTIKERPRESIPVERPSHTRLFGDGTR